jgi:hypothetical protein
MLKASRLVLSKPLILQEFTEHAYRLFAQQHVAQSGSRPP